MMGPQRYIASHRHLRPGRAGPLPASLLRDDCKFLTVQCFPARFYDADRCGGKVKRVRLHTHFFFVK